MLGSVGIIVVGYFALHWAYVIAMATEAAYEAGRLTPYWRVILFPVLVFGVLLDFVFNYTLGFMFLAKPAPYLFSQTVQHHVDHSEGWRLWLAAFWARTLNVFDDHVKPRGR